MSVSFQVKTREGLTTCVVDLSLDPSIKSSNVASLEHACSCWVSLLQDSPVGLKPSNTIHRFIRILNSGGIIKLIKEYSAYSDLLLNSINNYGSEDIFVYEYLNTPIAYDYIVFNKHHNPKLASYLLTFSLFLKKVEYEDDNFFPDALRGWKENERAVSSFDERLAKGEVDSYLPRLSQIVSELIPNFNVSSTDFKFGPGSVAGKTGRHVQDKVLNLKPDFLTKILLNSSMVHQPSSSVDTGMVLSDLGMDYASLRATQKREPSELLIVPKDISTARTICKEPNIVMFQQQAVLAGFVRAFRKGPIKQFVTLSDQERSRLSAKFGSEYGAVDTIDLSSASDRVSYNLIKRIFPKKILFFLRATRSSEVITPEGVVTVAKFAPMGSALCFPVQCILFTAITLLAYELESENLPWDTILRRQRLHVPTVYGDDIICDSSVTNKVICLLELFGLKVNTRKSFMGGNAFRESCGIYCFAGHDVTPLRFKVKGLDKTLSPSAYIGLIDLCNRSALAGYRYLRKRIIQLVHEMPLQGRSRRRGLIPFTEYPNLFGIRTSNLCIPSKVRMNYDLQLLDSYSLTVRTVSEDSTSSLLEAYLYYRGHGRVDVGDTEVSNFSTRSRAADLRFSEGWIPLR